MTTLQTLKDRKFQLISATIGLFAGGITISEKLGLFSLGSFGEAIPPRVSSFILGLIIVYLSILIYFKRGD